MKLLAGISLGVFVMVAGSLVLAGYWTGRNKTDSSGQNTTQNTDSQGTSDAKIFTTEVVAKHNTSGDCWIIIDGSIYNVTSFIPVHPGGAEKIIPYCGADATEGFATKNKPTPQEHSPTAKSMLEKYFVGKLGQAQVNNPANTPGQDKTVASADPSIAPAASVQLTTAEVAKHNSGNSCWLIISNKVYDVTAYIGSHPGGAARILNYCGKEATTAFQTQGGGGSHSSFAYNTLGNYYLGSLNTNVSLRSSGATASGSTGTGTANSGLQTSISGITGGSATLPAVITAKYPDAIYLSGKYEDEGAWEGKISTGGACKAIKVSENGNISQDERC